MIIVHRDQPPDSASHLPPLRHNQMLLFRRHLVASLAARNGSELLKYTVQLCSGVRVSAILMAPGLDGAVDQLPVTDDHLGSNVEAEVRISAEILAAEILPRLRPFLGMLGNEAVSGANNACGNILALHVVELGSEDVANAADNEDRDGGNAEEKCFEATVHADV